MDQLCCQDYGYICCSIFSSSTPTIAQFNFRKALGCVDCSHYLCFNVHYILPLPGAFSTSYRLFTVHSTIYFRLWELFVRMWRVEQELIHEGGKRSRVGEVNEE